MGIASPSKVFTKIGEYTVLGFIRGLKSFGSGVISAATDVGDSAIGTLRNAMSKAIDVINDDSDFTPVIRPVLDLDEIQNGMRNISDILNQDNEIADKIANDKNTPGVNSEKQNPGDKKQGNSYNFVQNNYSPKPLSRIDIYRQTKNQFSAVKAQVEGQ